MVSRQRLKGLGDRAELRSRQVGVFRRALEPLSAREVREARSAIRSAFSARAAADFDAWMEEFYPAHEERMAEALRPVVLDYGERVGEVALAEVGGSGTPNVQLFSRRYALGMAGRWANESVSALRKLMRDEEEAVGDALLETVGNWQESRTGQTAEREATQGGGAFAKLTFLLEGVQELVWRSLGESCPLCEQLNGRVVAITQPFVEEGEELEAEAEGGTRRMTTRHMIGHPPLHGSGGKGVCDCLVSAR